MTVITADIIRSREAGDLLAALSDRLAAVEHPLLVTAFSMSRGDEIQGVCRGPLQAPELVRQLRFACLPLRLRVGVGIGEIEAGQGSASSWDMNGSAFTRAREALESLGKGAAPLTAVCSGDPGFDETANALWTLMDAICQRWTPGQWDAVHHYERLGTYEAAGKALGIALQNVQKRCKAASWPAVKQAEQALRRLGQRGHASPWSG
ncbi:MAG: SatD family protein [Bacillota bacterium]|nr:SatD family protein [Bacillota bacterium]